jgi:hypothetical protein
MNAQIVFVEADQGGRWLGRLLRPARALDRQRGGRPVVGTPRFDVVEQGGRFIATMQGGRVGGRRYRSFPTLTTAQEAGIRWAARRFQVEG